MASHNVNSLQYDGSDDDYEIIGGYFADHSGDK